MTSCTCANPPGGGGSCGANQMAFCDYSSGVCITSCIDATSAISAARGSLDELFKWVIRTKHALLGTDAGQDLFRFQSDPAFGQSMRNGVYIDEYGQAVAHFELPASRAMSLP